jgi:hypothetical protein
MPLTMRPTGKVHEGPGGRTSRAAGQQLARRPSATPACEPAPSLARKREPLRWSVDHGAVFDWPVQMTKSRQRGGSRTRIPTALRQNLRAVTGLSAVLGLALTFIPLPAAAQQWIPKQRAACEPDAMRLCNQYIPDAQRVSDCMSAYRRYLSPACRAVFYGGQRKKVRRR